ncbi:DUF2058 domain-containing protein [Desulforhopalus singaporensis]|uniref:Nucleoprotein/polynucleotide-associated enzyme n=1 Tax=Desulforhopalus singaporensis TaxID=91360 RepID=A0A1H0M2G9_9BACT|nr:DUF2058 domain-containing protein [Desulforhopalus singaporensis]SDO74595.1 hypothetical protein SAMN05660330_00957 [Desulforhopalus singaporensis]
MGKTFQEQLLKLGLVDKKKANEVKKQKHQQKKKTKGKRTDVIADENLRMAKEAQEKKKARARELNKEREAKLQKRAEDAKIKQLVEQHKVAGDDGGVAYRFNVSGKIHRIFVTKKTADMLSSGQLGIVELGEQFEVIPKAVAEKIRANSNAVFIHLTTAAPTPEASDPDDPYADYKVPDDLMW